MAIPTVTKMQEAMMEAIKENPYMILCFKTKLVTLEMWQYAVSVEPRLFEHCKVADYTIATIAVMADGLHLGNIDPLNYTADQYTTICQLAVEQNPKAIMLVPKEFRSNKLMAYAYSKDPELMLSEDRLTEDMIGSIIDHNPSLIQHVVDPTDDMIIRALSKDPRVIVYFAKLTPKVRQYFEEYYPQYANLVIHD